MRSLTVLMSLLILTPIKAFSWVQILPPSIEPLDPIPMDSSGVEPRPGGVFPMTMDQIRTLMIEQSIAENPDCPCPYSPDRVGGQCGTESLYFRAGGYRIKCFLKDISSREVYFWKLKYATPWPFVEERPAIIFSTPVPAIIETIPRAVFAPAPAMMTAPPPRVLVPPPPGALIAPAPVVLGTPPPASVIIGPDRP